MPLRSSQKHRMTAASCCDCTDACDCGRQRCAHFAFRRRAVIMTSHELENVPLAIIGMECRLPGADNRAAFWQMLKNGGSGIVELPPDRLDRQLYFDPRKGQLNKSYSALGGLVAARPLDRSICPL